MIYIQSDLERKLPHHFDAACALYGAIENCMSYSLISFEKLTQSFFAPMIIKGNAFVGSVEFMAKVWDILGKDPKIPNANREFETLTLEKVRDRVSNSDLKLFVKPFQMKLFTGLVVDKIWIGSLRNFPNDLEVMVYEVLPPIISEWRVYVHNHMMVDARNYSGDFKQTPKWLYVEEQIKKNKNTFPCAYVMDIGLLDHWLDHSTVIEYNDMWAVGNYGISNDLYVRMLKDRYFEIINS